MIRCAIIDGLDAIDSLPRRVDWIQVRDKTMPARSLMRLVQALVGRGPRIIVNTRLDVALAAGAHGLHLPAGSLPPSRLRVLTDPGFLIGVSCHSLRDVVRAEEEGADYVYLSPIFVSPSKPGYGPAIGLDALREVCRLVRLPVLALGGVDEDRAPACIAAGAAGFASISAFSESK
jgi:thiamine-phosphate pyrophosphorylase